MAGDIIKGEEYFFTNIYEGTGTGQRVGKFLPFTDNGTIAKSCIFDGSGHYLDKTFSGAGNRQTWTWSGWFKKTSFGGDRFDFFSGGTGSSDTTVMECQFQGDNIRITGYNTVYLKTNRTFEDCSKFYHILVAFDSTQSTASNRMKLYVDGDEITSFSTDNRSSISQNTDYGINQASSHTIGRYSGSDNFYLNGYLAEVNFVDGSARTPADFGLTDTSTGRWIPKTLTGISYGTNGFRMEFANSAGQTIGDDTSGNTNDFTVNNLVASDITTDSPTQNFMVWDAARALSHVPVMSEGNLKVGYTSGSGTYPVSRAGKEIPQSGKWYWEVKCTHTGGVQGISNPGMGVIDLNIKDIPDFSSSKPFVQTKGGMGSMFYGGFIFNGLLTDTSSGGDFTTSTAENIANNDYMLFAFDMDNGKAWWGWNNSSAGSSVVWFANDGGTDGDPGAGTNPTVTFDPKSHRFVPAQGAYAPGSYPGIFEFNFGQKTYAFTAPTGFIGLSQNNFPTTEKGIPDLVWIKNRDQGDGHQVYDSSRGPQKDLQPDATNAESTTTDGLQKFLKGGCQIEDDVSVNSSGESYVSWNWVANGGTTSANTDGSGATLASTIQANQTAGFSIVEYTGNGTAGAKVAHGLSQAPDFIITKRLNSTNSWHLYLSTLGETKYSLLDINNNQNSDSALTWNDTAPDATTFTLGSGNTNNDTGTFIAYCWHSVEGFSKIGSYTGNGNADGTFVYTGFKPTWLLTKKTSGSGNWVIMDSTRSPTNPLGFFFSADSNIAEVTTSTRQTDFLSNGFKFRGNNDATNLSGQSYTYMAFAEHPFNGDGTSPATAR